MRVPRIYSSLPLSAHAKVALDERAVLYVSQVLRLKPGDQLYLFDGQGAEYQAVLEIVGKQGVEAQILGQITRHTESPLRITLGQGISRGERMDYALQKAVELGVSSIIPLFTEYSTVKLSLDRVARRLRHWQGVILSACEQCGRSYLPSIDNPQQLTVFLHTSYEGMKIVLDPENNQSLKALPPPLGGQLALLIGPEGGLSEAEIKQAQHAGFIGTRLGPRILRTETATVAALASVQLLWGDL
ncbi:ribosomal RNA small subunit methyltransferase E [Candidatus Nitrosoglobus terrae]|uniref:Ribosomal RNA small subunit methyltransferase E n=1 Tax=Candidatus Nitrosoglobus terrae TaxID=1630141 RepID=A0A1Q2SPE1_9GAMM|nr:16S rRNA (uracil(1498)-N(3))-methyltransferase [Candidatus Nitrosoglobus terrae]BAW80959.1 ribosomal RNA small subunit methyltransferase E [Candidatus Nitrosoglobus terrae]